MKSKLLICLFLVSSAFFVSCSNDDDSSNNNNGQFEDKWWYSEDGSALDVFFDSDGTYESVFVFAGQTIPSNGEWEWVNESAGTFHVFNLTGNATSQYHGKVINLTDDSMAIQISFDGGETYSTTAQYVDTNN